MSEPVAWIPVGVQWPFEDLDILFSDGSVLMSVIPQVDGDFWWRGGGAGERFFDPAHSEVTHWRPHVDLNGKTLLTAVQEALAERNALARDAARYREFVVSGGWHRHIDGEHPEESYSYLVVGLPVDADLSCYAARKLAMDKVLDEGRER